MQENDITHLQAEITKADDGSFIAVASTNSVDRHGEIVDNNGWDLKAFKKNPVILWGHDHTEPAIGVSKRTWVEGSGKKARLMITPVLHDVTERARAVKALIEMGVIKTLSVGFKPLESPDGVTFTKNELLEVSMVNVPANADAQMLAYKGLKKEGFDPETIQELGVNTELLDTLDQMQKNVSELDDKVTDLTSMVKAQKSVNPSNKTDTSRERLSMLKVIARASDKLLEAEKKQVPVESKQLAKVIKRATEKIIVAEKENL